MKRVLVTGGCGLIGQHICSGLLKKGYEVIAVDAKEGFYNTGKEPNDAHKALAEYGVPVITMNVDTLHEMAGTKDIIKLHGRLPTEEEWSYCDKLYNTPVLYEDPAPMYQKGYDWIWLLEKGDIFLVIGASTYTIVSSQMRICALGTGAEVVEIQDNAGTKVRAFLEKNKDKIESMDAFLKRIDKYEDRV